MINLDAGIEVFTIKIMVSLIFEINDNSIYIDIALIDQDITALF